MPARTADPIYISEREAACLDAVRSGADTKTRVALHTRLDLKQTESALARLAFTGFLEKRERRWCIAPLGERAVVSVVPGMGRQRGGKHQGEVRPDTSSGRLLALLTRPRHGADLASELGVTRQRVHQLVVRLAALGLVRIGDPDRPLDSVARSDDPSVLLPAIHGTVLSAFPKTTGTTLAKIAKASGRSSGEIASVIGFLIEERLAEVTRHSRRGDLFRLTPAGHAHWQRRPLARTADLPALPVRSNRVWLVLAHLAQHGPTRTYSVGQALGIPRASANALMQYLKRKGLVRKSGTDLNAPHELTTEGEETLRAMGYEAPSSALLAHVVDAETNRTPPPTETPV